MRNTVRKALFLFCFLSISVVAFAGYKPKIGPGFVPDIGEGEGNTTGGGCNTEVTLPVGLPVEGDETATSNENNTNSKIVYTFDLSQEDGAASMNQTHSALEKAKGMNAACVLIRIDGFAGGWDVAENIRQEILGYDRPVMVYVNNQTVPAANFISMSADSIYTKKGSLISNKKSSNNKSSKANSVQKTKQQAVIPVTSDISTPAKPDAAYSNDVTMNEILYKAGLGNLTVVEHEASYAERATDFMMNPFVIVCVLLLIGIVMRKTVKSTLPGPMMYVLAFTALLYLAPFQLSGLANGGEILASVALIIAVIASARYENRWLTAISLIGLTFMFALVRTGDTDAILRYGSFSELLPIASMPIGVVILGWWIGKIGERRKVREVASNVESVSALATAA